MMKRRLSLILLVSIVALASQAQLLWKVSGNGLGRPSYVMGTHHMAPASMIDEIPGLDAAIKGCDIVVGEIEKDSLMDQGSQLRMAKYMIAPSDSTLDKLYTPEQYAIIEGVFDKYSSMMGIKLSYLNPLKPNAVTAMLQQLQALKHFPDFEAGNFIDLAVQTRANEAGRPSAGLESVQEQVEMLFNSPLADQARDLLETCLQDDKFELLTDELTVAYKTQDLDKIMAVMTESAMEGGEDSLERLLYSRNRRWIEKLVVMMPERACLVCVGAGHLPGEQGLLQLLRDRGYTVEPMK